MNFIRIKAFVDPVLEITEITDRVTKSGGKAYSLKIQEQISCSDKCFWI